jgi:hypothetical protein
LFYPNAHHSSNCNTLTALADFDAYKLAKNLTDTQLLAIGDIDGDGKPTNADLQALLNLVKSGVGSVSVVPEPTAWLSTGIAIVIYLGHHFLLGRCRRPRSYS